jgi:radical SAM protein with 4Fe4S-binding SPASM domain
MAYQRRKSYWPWKNSASLTLDPEVAMSKQRPKVGDELQVERRYRAGEEVYFVLDPASPAWAVLNQHGLSVLERCDGSRTLDQISAEIAQDYGVSQEEARNGTDTLLSHISETGLLVSDHPLKQEGLPKRNRFQSLAIEITRRCNLNCQHCFLAAGEADPRELSLEEIKHVIGQIKHAGGTSVSFGGGEPLLRDDWLEIVQYALAQGLLVAIGSNGTLIDTAMAKTLSQQPIKIQISLDGAKADIHDRIRGPGSFQNTLQGINNLIAAGKLNDLVVAFTPMRPNLREVPAFLTMMQQLGITIVQFPPLACSGRARRHWQSLQLSDAQRYWLWQYLSRRSGELKGRLDIIADCLSIDIHKPGVPYRCSIGSQLRMDPHGDIYPCQCFHFGSEFCLGNIRELDLVGVVKGERLKTIIEACIDRPDKISGCGRCRWRNFCGAGCMGNAYEATGCALNADRCKVRKRWIETLFETRAGLSV